MHGELRNTSRFNIQGQNLDARGLAAPQEYIVIPNPDMQGTPEGSSPYDAAPGAFGEPHVGEPSADFPGDPHSHDLEILPDPSLGQPHSASNVM